MFEGTIRNNICYGIEDEDSVSLLAVHEAGKLSNSHGFIMNEAKFPDGYSTLIGEKGVKLSGG